MKWLDVEIADLSDDELRLAIWSVSDIDKNRLDKLEQAKPRHKKIFKKKTPAVENPVFTNLATELNNEFKKRELKEINNGKSV